MKSAVKHACPFCYSCEVRGLCIQTYSVHIQARLLCFVRLFVESFCVSVTLHYRWKPQF